jgi:hypothetical protein
LEGRRQLFDLNIPEWTYANYPRMFLYNDAQVNIIEEALPFPLDHKSKGIQNAKVMIIWIQPSWLKLFPKFVFFCKVKGHGIIECPKIDSEVKEVFVKHVGQQMLERHYVEQPYNW